jgi:mannose-1-phosphate guanylyltransferase
LTQALILAGGEGTRLRPLTLTMPKPAIQLVDRPFLRYMIDWVGRYGIEEVVIASGFGADVLRAALGDGGSGGPRIAYVQETEPLGTGGPLRLAADQGLLEQRFLVLNGDLLTDLDLGALMGAHEDNGAVATVALYPVDDPSAYGLVRRAGGPDRPGGAPEAATGEVAGFVEKPEPGDVDTNEISAGAYVLERRVIDMIPTGGMVSIEREVFPRLVGHGLYGHALEGYWMDIGTPERYLQASWDILEGRVRTEAGARLDGAGLLVEDGSGIDPAATVQPPALLEADVTVGAEASIGARAVVGRGATVGEGAVLSSSVVLARSVIGSRARIHDSVVAPGVRIGDGARIGPGAVIGEGAQVDAGAELGEGARLAPGELVS